VLYRERSGEETFGHAGVMNAGAFSIQRLEGSRFGRVGLWVLNDGYGGEGWAKREWIVPRRRNPCGREGFPQSMGQEVGDADTLGAWVFASARKSC
jgi:hypothetical protein